MLWDKSCNILFLNSTFFFYWQIDGSLAAVDATKEPKLGERFKVSGYPTVKYFK